MTPKRFLPLCFILFCLFSSCILNDPSSPPDPSEKEEFTLLITDLSGIINKTLNSSVTPPVYENTYYYASSPSGVLTLTPDIEIKDNNITYTIESSTGKSYSSPFLSDENKTLGRQNGSSLNLFLSNFDTLATYTVKAIHNNLIANYVFNINSSPSHPLSSSLSINYSTLKIDDNNKIILHESSNKNTSVSLIADSSDITLIKGKVYSIFVNDDILSNPFGRLSWSIENNIENESGFCSFVKDSTSEESILTQEMTTSSECRNVYFYANTSSGIKNKITIKAGDKDFKTFYVTTIDSRELNEDLNNFFTLHSVPIVGGVRILCTLTNSNLYDKYYASLALNGAVDREDLFFGTEGVAYYDYTPSTISADSLTIPVKLKIVSNIGSTDTTESADKEINITIHKIPQSATIETKSKDNPSPLIVSNSLRPPIPDTQTGSWNSYTSDERVFVHIKPVDLSNFAPITMLDEAEFIVEKNGTILYSRPYVLNNFINTTEIIYPIVATSDGGVYKAYVRDIKGCINNSSSSAVITEVSASDIKANVIFFPYTSIDTENAIYKVMVCDIPLNPGDFNLYVQYSVDKGETWSDILTFDGTLVYSDNREDINKGAEITSDGSSVYFKINSKDVLFRSLIVAKEENSYHVRRPTTGIRNENGEYVTTSSLQIATPAVVSDEIQEYYNARQITIERPNENYSVYYYYEKNNNGSLSAAIVPGKCINTVPFGEIIEITSTGDFRKIGNTNDKNKAVLLTGKTAVESNVIALGKNAIITKTVDNENTELSPSFSYTRCDFFQCESPNVGTGCSGWDWLGAAGHGLYLINHTGFYPQFTWCGFVDKNTNKDHPADGYRQYWDKPLNGWYLFWEDRTASGGCWVTAYYSKIGYLDSEMKTANHHTDTASQPRDATWIRYPLNTNYKVIRKN